MGRTPAVRHFAAILTVAIAPAIAGARSPDAAGILDRYLAGDFSGAVRAALEQDREAFVRAYGREVAGWVDAAEGDTKTRRRLAAATFALEYAHDAKAPEDEFWTPGWWYSKVLVEPACRLLRDAPDVHPAEVTWFLASIALARAAGDSRFLAGGTPRVTGPDRDIGTREEPPERRSGLQYLSGGIMTEQQRHRQFAELSGMGHSASSP